MNRAINLTLWVIILFILGGLIAREYAIYHRNIKKCPECPECPSGKECDPCPPCPIVDGANFNEETGKHTQNV